MNDETQTTAPQLHLISYDLKGIIQGVGFRPTVCRLARAAGLGGSIQNRADSVRLTLEGRPENLRNFMAALPRQLPPHARIDSCALVEDRPLPPGRQAGLFAIEASGGTEPPDILIPADLAICSDCLREVFEPSDRRHGYPFTTCTQCGPRYTVINAMPYDRVRTTLSAFPLCPTCRQEYETPDDRRFHAESIACPACGPKLWMEDAKGHRLDGDPLRRARAALADGAIVAVRGLGGFLLAADAFNREGLINLRRRKLRPDKPFAVMARKLACIRQACDVPPEVEELLQSPKAPIVILDVRPETGTDALPMDLLSPDTATLGVMLPTTPLHALLTMPLPGDPVRPFDWLVMTSGNRGGEPICISNDEARDRLRGIADYLLLHDREINLRNDDSLCALQQGKPQVWRRTRGFAPNPIRLQRPLARCVLAMGAELKNAIAIAFADRTVFSPHVGDLEAVEAVEGLRQVAEALPRFVNRTPQAVAVDLHPDMQCTRIGREIAASLGIPVIEVQHHHAHAVAALGEHGHRAGLALVFDGTGLGLDGHVWGAELLDCDGPAFRRLASFSGAPLPGGDAAVRHPARQLVGRAVAACIELPAALCRRSGISDEQLRVWTQQCQAGINAPVTHSAGRLFDAISAMLGLAPSVTTYEGQTAIRLEAAARRHRPSAADPTLGWRAEERGDRLWIDWSPTVARLAANACEKTADADAWAYAAHVAIADAAAKMAAYGVERTGRRLVALSGGVFMNRILTRLVVSRLEAMAITALVHREVPPNDGGVALGQAIVAGS